MPMDVVNQRDAVPFTTVDGSTIRELLAHRNSSIRQQSLAEARLAPGCATTPHHHAVTEEIYYILSGTADMTLGHETRAVGPGDAIAIPRACGTRSATPAPRNWSSSARAPPATSTPTPSSKTPPPSPRLPEPEPRHVPSGIRRPLFPWPDAFSQHPRLRGHRLRRAARRGAARGGHVGQEGPRRGGAARLRARQRR